jgi:hypothetical protein
VETRRMIKAKTFAIFYSAVLAFATLMGGQAVGKDCFFPVREALASGGYTGGLDCTKIDVTLRKVGPIQIGRKSYLIYNLVYKTRSISPHGGQRILIFGRKQNYLGQYSLDTPPFHKVWVEGLKIKFDDTPEHGNVIALDENGPPDHVYLFQENEDFYK